MLQDRTAPFLDSLRQKSWDVELTTPSVLSSQPWHEALQSDHMVHSERMQSCRPGCEAGFSTLRFAVVDRVLRILAGDALVARFLVSGNIQFISATKWQAALRVDHTQEADLPRSQLEYRTLFVGVAVWHPPAFSSLTSQHPVLMKLLVQVLLLPGLTLPQPRPYHNQGLILTAGLPQHVATSCTHTTLTGGGTRLQRLWSAMAGLHEARQDLRRLGRL